MTQEFDDSAKKFLLEILSVHEGEENRISSEDLRIQLSIELNSGSIIEWDNPNGMGRLLDLIDPTKMRKLITKMRLTKEGTMICAHNKGGYFMARDKQELDKFTQPDYKAAKSLFYRIHKQRKNAGLIDQLEMELEI